jgi:Tol biopolymer transport system component
VDSRQRSWQIARISGEGLRPIAGIPGDDHSLRIAWHPDSRHFAFVTTQDNQDHVWIAQTSDEDVSLLTRLPVEASCPSLQWSASGQYISCRSHIIEWPSGQIHTRPKNTQDYEQLRWSPDGDYLLIESSDFWVWDAERQESISMDSGFEACEWAPSNSWLACWGLQSDVTVLSFPAGDTIRVNAVGDRQVSIEWSPTGRWLAVVESALWDEGKNNFYIIDVTTGEVMRIVEQVSEWSFAWTPSCATE